MRLCNAIYFSPTDTTKKVTRMVIEDFCENVIETDITTSVNEISFKGDDFVVIGIPVYSGRVPAIAWERLMSIRGDKTPVALIATYGNRHYDDALLELKTLVESNGFVVVAVAAFVTEHSVVRTIGTGRPDAEDIKSIMQFRGLLIDKMNSWNIDDHVDLRVNGNPEYRKYQSIPVKPHATSSCTKCGLCARNCPVGAIPIEHPEKTSKEKCITCVRCIRNCPQGARNFSKIEKIVAEKTLKKLCKEYKVPEMFL